MPWAVNPRQRRRCGVVYNMNVLNERDLFRHCLQKVQCTEASFDTKIRVPVVHLGAMRVLHNHRVDGEEVIPGGSRVKWTSSVCSKSVLTL